jgi:hypothetical protein
MIKAVLEKAATATGKKQRIIIISENKKTPPRMLQVRLNRPGGLLHLCDEDGSSSLNKGPCGPERSPKNKEVRTMQKWEHDGKGMHVVFGLWERVCRKPLSFSL